MIKHFHLRVDSDQQKEANFEGSLYDFGAIKLNEELDKICKKYKIININHAFYTQEIRPRMDNSSTWYDQDYIRFHVWYEDLQEDISSEVDDSDIYIEMGRFYDSKGANFHVEMSVPYETLKTFRLHKSCGTCPNGYMQHDCGRNVPFTDEDYKHRPETCKLLELSIEDVIQLIRKHESEIH